MEPAHESTVENLFNARLQLEGPCRVQPPEVGIVAVHGQDLVAAVTLGAATTGGHRWALVRGLAVTLKWERRGLATVLLGMIPQLVPVSFIFGGCSPDAAEFYQRAGFDVLAAGEPLPTPFGRSLASSNPFYPSWFFRFA